VIVFNSPNDGRAIAIASGSVFNYNPDADAVISRRTPEGNLLAGAVFYNHIAGASVRVHIAAFKPMAINRDLLWCCFDYPFNQLKCKKLLAFLPSTNAKSIALATHLGLKEEARVQDAYVEGDLIVMSMKREECRWLSIQPKGIQRNA
jgi:RimJ/RimL family protein N-acetyltransferase